MKSINTFVCTYFLGKNSPFQEEVQSAPGQNHFYSNYTTVYALIIIDSQSEPEDNMEQSTEYLTAAHIVAELSAEITNTSCSRFNINRASVWDGAIRGFKGASFDPSHEMSVKFTDDEGHTEDGGDTGGPKREFLTLLMERLRMKKTSRQQLFVPHGGVTFPAAHCLKI
ncbi:G2/M phase-specific E3 ubiquitin-protein ligase-like isoform X2 [Gymnodraco acuticeps]|uniref:G2/M phase-specific E3 ubiquitin-protein ligase-like isoform X2 n=1 Tax=Gymnodraco acuticeps TaxID=8218 RepID=A0A6P8VBU0_GYMAC|nr:G2/M phase-specific E3 ubiquitin-protein ligase-like isoform X2 [Gymnodraco acuticeps]